MLRFYRVVNKDRKSKICSVKKIEGVFISICHVLQVGTLSAWCGKQRSKSGGEDIMGANCANRYRVLLRAGCWE